MADVTDHEPVVSGPRVAAYEACTPAEREMAICQLLAARGAIDAELVDVVTAADRQADWRADGATDMAAWLMGHGRVSRSTARDWVRVGAALDDLPALRDALAQGRVSFDQVRLASRFATPERDEALAQEVPGRSVAELEVQAARHRRLTRTDATERARRRRFGWRADPDAGGYRYHGFLPDTEATHLNTTLDRLAQQHGPDPETGLWAPFESRAADALVTLAHTTPTPPGADPTLVVVHVPAATIDGHVDHNGIVGTLPLPRDSVLRLLCDTRLEYAIDTPEGTCVGIGRRGRTIPPPLRRAITHRDQTCRFPGCHRPIRHLHHIRHWCQGGATNSDNLIGLCWEHHHLVHDADWTITGNPNGVVTFTSPYGRTLPTRPPPLRPDVRQHIQDTFDLHLHSTTDPVPTGASP